MDSKNKPRVVITGITGYVGSHICLAFLKHGGFRVRGTARDPNNTKKINPLRVAFGPLFSELEIVKADLNDEESLIEACSDCEYVVHTASPFSLTFKSEEEAIKPAVQGTLSVLKGARRHGAKRVVITSSVVSIHCTRDPYKKCFDELDWSDLSVANAYEKSKTLAEKAAWDYVKQLPENEKFELVAINPGFILGPNLVLESC